MNKFKADIEIDAPRSKVWEVVADLSQIQNYSAGVAKSFYTSENREGVGASRHCDLKPFGAVEEAILEWKDGESYKIAIVPGKGAPPIKNAYGRFTIHDAGETARVEFELGWDMKFGPVGAIMNAMMVKSQFKKALSGTLAGLKHFCETGESVDSGVMKRTAAATPTVAAA